MSNKTIQIKSGTTNPTSLLQAELALNTSNSKLFTSTNGSNIINLTGGLENNIQQYNETNSTIPCINGSYIFTLTESFTTTLDSPSINAMITIYNNSSLLSQLKIVSLNNIDIYLSGGDSCCFLSNGISWFPLFIPLYINVEIVPENTTSIYTNEFYNGKRILITLGRVFDCPVNSYQTINNSLNKNNCIVLNWTGYFKRRSDGTSQSLIAGSTTYLLGNTLQVILDGNIIPVQNEIFYMIKYVLL